MIGSKDFEKLFFLYSLKNPKYLKSIHKNDSLIGLKRYPKRERTILLSELFNLGYLKFDGMINNKGIEFLNKKSNPKIRLLLTLHFINKLKTK